MNETQKIAEYLVAIKAYDERYFYKKVTLLTSYLVVALQFVTLFNFLYNYQPISIISLIALFILCYLITDFVNGAVHMYMDNNTNYTSACGPLIAAFHLHHKTTAYKRRNILAVYFHESGSKYWLALYLLILAYSQHQGLLNVHLNFVLVGFGILSSIAEVSHYLCHNSKPQAKITTWLQNGYILLGKKHHSFHHRKDNMNYAFLNGLTDPLLNMIARHWCGGYKNRSDKYTAAYQGTQTSNRD